MSKEIGPTPRERCLAMLRYVNTTVLAMHGAQGLDADQERALTACSVALAQACNALEFVCGRDAAPESPKGLCAACAAAGNVLVCACPTPEVPR